MCIEMPKRNIFIIKNYSTTRSSWVLNLGLNKYKAVVPYHRFEQKENMNLGFQQILSSFVDIGFAILLTTLLTSCVGT
jgi:hypothetical protein